MPEFELIRRLQERIGSSPASGSSACIVGIGDDAAVLKMPTGRNLVVCTDTLVEGVHFPTATAAHAVGYKSLAVNLSDLAAMGADPAWFLMALTLPGDDLDWVDEFADGMAALAARAGIELVGGDTTSGALTVSITAAGTVAPGQALTRQGAAPGDLVAISGIPGRAANALSALQSGRAADPGEHRALDYPEPRLALGRALRGLATACIDVSDGLLADLGHVLQQSQVAAELDLGQLPSAGHLATLEPEKRWALQLSGGDDYELCFTVPANEAHRLDAIAEATGTPVTVIGEIRAGSGVYLTRPDGHRYPAAVSGYQHFAEPDNGTEIPE